MRFGRAVGFCVFLGGLLGACAATAPDDLIAQYSSKAREVGIIPIFPPREEFQLGDIYIWSQSTTDPDDTVRVWVGSFDWLRADADAFLATRVVFRETGQTGKDQAAAQTADLYGPTTRTRGQQRTETLPISAFPSVSGDAGFTAGLGIFSALSRLGLAGGQRTNVTLDFNDVRTYWVPNVKVGAKVNGHLGHFLESLDPGLVRSELIRLGRNATRPVSDPCGEDRKIGLSVVTRVYLTREIDYTYRNARIVAAGLNRAAGTPPAAPAPVIPNVAVINVPSTSTSGEVSVNNDMLTSLQTILRERNDGESFAFQSWDARGLTYRQIFVRPVAIGWDGFNYTGDLRGDICPAIVPP